MANTQTLPDRRKEITLEKMRLHSGPKKNIHTDQEKAEAAGFEKPVMAGVQIIGYLSEWLFDQYEDAWLESGVLTTKFVGVVMPGDTLVLSGEIIDGGSDETEMEIECYVPQEGDDRTVIVGSASVSSCIRA